MAQPTSTAATERLSKDLAAEADPPAPGAAWNLSEMLQAPRPDRRHSVTAYRLKPALFRATAGTWRKRLFLRRGATKTAQGEARRTSAPGSEPADRQRQCLTSRTRWPGPPPIEDRMPRPRLPHAARTTSPYVCTPCTAENRTGRRLRRSEARLSHAPVPKRRLPTTCPDDGPGPSAVGVQAVEERVVAVPPPAADPSCVGQMRVPGGQAGVLVLDGCRLPRGPQAYGEQCGGQGDGAQGEHRGPEPGRRAEPSGQRVRAPASRLCDSANSAANDGRPRRRCARPGGQQPCARSRVSASEQPRA